MKCVILFFVLLLELKVNGQDKTDSVNRSKIGIYLTFHDFQQKMPGVIKPFAIDTLKYWENTDSAITEYTYHFLDSSANLKDWFLLYDGKDLYTQAIDGAIQKTTIVGTYPYQIYIHDAGRKYIYGRINTSAEFTAVSGIQNILIAVLSSEKVWLRYFNNKGEIKEPNAYSFAKFLKEVDQDLYKRFIKEQKLKLKDYIRYLDELNIRHPF